MTLATFARRVLGITPPGYTRAEVIEDRARSILHGLTVAPLEPIAWDANMVEVPAPDRDDDDAVDAFSDAGGFVIWPEDLGEPATLDERAAEFVRDVADVYAVPGPWSWRRWGIVRRWNRLVSRVGVGPRAGWSWCSDWSGTRESGPWGWTWPLHRRRWTCDGEPRVSWSWGYFLDKPGWWWECWIRQARAERRPWRWHRPCEPVALGICAACLPCPECGQPYCTDEGACLQAYGAADASTS